MGQNIARMCTVRKPSHSMTRRRVNFSPGQNRKKANMPLKTVDISNDTWLEALKFMTFPQWIQKCLVSCQINGIAQRNVSRLPRMVLDRVAMYYDDDIWGVSGIEKLRLDKYTIVVSDTVLQKAQGIKWLMKRGFTLDAPKDIPAKTALITNNDWMENQTTLEWKSNIGWGIRLPPDINVCIYGHAKENIKLPKDMCSVPWYENEWKRPVLYYAQFNPLNNKYSWNYLAQFLELVYHPSSCLKQVKMYAVNQNFIDSLKCNIDSVDNGPRYIRCESFSLESCWSRFLKPAGLSSSLKWMELNVRAETIYISVGILFNETSVFVLLANFLLEAKQCASKKTKIHLHSEPASFLNILIEKFRRIPLVENVIPTFEFTASREPTRLGPNLINQEVDSQGADALYMISNGQNRMRVSFHWNNRYYECSIRVYSI